MKLIKATLLLSILAIMSLAIAQRNKRPVGPLAPASELISNCTITVQFNENEASVPEADYMYNMFCLGVMEGITGTNRMIHSINPKSALFCPFRPDFKSWHAAKIVVEYAKQHPDSLAMESTEFAITALSDAFPCVER